MTDTRLLRGKLNEQCDGENGPASRITFDTECRDEDNYPKITRRIVGNGDGRKRLQLFRGGL